MAEKLVQEIKKLTLMQVIAIGVLTFLLIAFLLTVYILGVPACR